MTPLGTGPRLARAHGASFHPATLTRLVFELLGLSTSVKLGNYRDAEQRVERSCLPTQDDAGRHVPSGQHGYFIHFININTERGGCGWMPSYTPIGTALLVPVAIAQKQFPANANIAALANS